MQFCIYLGLTLSEANLDGITLVGYKRLWEKIEGQIVYPHSLTPEPQYEAVKQRTRGIGMVSSCFTKANKHTRHWSVPFSNCPFHHLRMKVLSWFFHCLRKQHRSLRSGRYSHILAGFHAAGIDLLSRCHGPTTPTSMVTVWPVHLLWAGLGTVPELRMLRVEGRVSSGKGQWSPKA